MTWLALGAPALMTVSFLAVLLVGKRFRNGGVELGLGVNVINVVLAVALAAAWNANDKISIEASTHWFEFAGKAVDAAIRVDGLAIALIVLVAVVSLAVNVFSSAYMKDDRRKTHFYAVLLLFSAAMQLFVISDNLLQLVFGWEVMALCSFLLIGHWWEEKHNVAAAMKAFLTTRVSDVGLLLGVAVLFYGANFSFSVTALNEAAANNAVSRAVLVTGAVALFVAVIGKSAQFPLHTWLPDAMAGPTPMSALIHAATMVVAGVFLVLRLYPVFDSAFGITDGSGTANVIVIIGAVTVVIAALLAFLQHDIKKVLSYSTVSQLGYMVLALGAGAPMAALFHLVVHGFSKAALFLAAGSISRSVHGYDLRGDMGDLHASLPFTHASFLVSSLCLVGVIPFSAFWSKELMVVEMTDAGFMPFIWVLVLGSVMTAAYMARMYYLVFWGARRGSKIVRESPPAMTISTGVLALGAVLVGFGAIFIDRPQLHASGGWLAILVEAIFPLLGIALAVVCFKLGIGAVGLARRFKFARAAYHVLWNRYYLDWLYEHVIARTVRKGLSLVVHWFDMRIIDAFVDSFGRASVKVGKALMNRLERDVVDGTVNAAGGASMRAGGLLARSQAGRVQRYVAVSVTAMVLAAMVLMWVVQ